MAKPKDKKTRKVRTRSQRIEAMRRKIAEEEAKEALESLKTAVKEGRVAKENQSEYRKLLRYMKTMDKAPEAFSAFGFEDEAKASAKLRDKLIGKLKKFLTDNPESDDSDEDVEDEVEETEEEETSKDESDESDDDDLEDDDDDEDDDEDDDDDFEDDDDEDDDD